MTLYEFLLFVHITAAIVWVGGSTGLQIYGSRALASNDAVRIEAVTRDGEFLGTRVFTPASLVVLGIGIWLVNEGNWSFTDFWIIAAIALIVASAGTGAAFLGPESGRIAKLIADKGAGDPEVKTRISRILLISRVELFALYVIVFLMATKPGA